MVAYPWFNSVIAPNERIAPANKIWDKDGVDLFLHFAFKEKQL